MTRCEGSGALRCNHIPETRPVHGLRIFSTVQLVTELGVRFVSSDQGRQDILNAFGGFFSPASNEQDPKWH